MRTSWIAIFFCCAVAAHAFQLVDMNLASAEQISLLPGVGKRLAENIVAERKRRSFSSVSDLTNVGGMTARKLEQIKDHVVFGSFTKKLVHKKIDKKEFAQALSIKPIIEIADLEKKVLSWQGLDPHTDRALASRVRLSAWLPQLSTYIDTDHGEIATKKKESDFVQTRGGRDVGFGIKAQFDLDKLIFNKDEIDVAKLALNRQERRNEILTHLRKQYFRYVQLARTRVDERDQDLKEKLSLELAEIKASLDALSGYAFSHHAEGISIREE